jgi:hypothetical protein
VSQFEQARSLDADGAVVVYVPAAQVEIGEQSTDSFAFSFWYLPKVQALQIVDLVSKE